MLVFKSKKTENDFCCFLLKGPYGITGPLRVLLADCSNGDVYERSLDNFIDEYNFVGEKNMSLDSPFITYK